MNSHEPDGFTLLHHGLDRLECSVRARSDSQSCAVAVDQSVTVTSDEMPAEADDEPVDTRVHFARCADGNGTLSHLFFSNDALDLARAKAICSRCGLAERCRAVAIERAEPYGVWGGVLIIDGVEVANKRGRGRPPKHPRPPIVVDEVPLPPQRIAS